MKRAPKLARVVAHRQRRDRAACCILVAPLFTDIGARDVVPRIGYLHARSADYVHFYCAGYGGDGDPGLVPDRQDIGAVKYENGVEISWWFSQQLFAEFVDELEKSTTWTRSSEAELIMMGPEVDFSEALTLDIHAMLDDGVIRSPGELFESIVRYARRVEGDRSAYTFSDLEGARELKRGAVDVARSILPKPIRGVWDRGKHFAVKDISR